MSKYWKLIPIILIIFGCFVITLSSPRACRTAQIDENEIDTIFIKRCAGCHGTDGVPKIADMPNFTDPKFQSSHTDEELTKSITEGKDPRMPAYGEILEKEEIEALVPYIRKLAKAKAEEHKAKAEENKAKAKKK